MAGRFNWKPPIHIAVFTSFISIFTHSAVIAEQLKAPIPMYEKGASTYYVKGVITGVGDTEFLVDTGSGYVTINESTLEILKVKGKAEYVKEILCVLANGQEDIVPVYRLTSIRLGNDCILNNVEAAVLPGTTRQILGLSGLKRAGSFSFSFEPPQLTLSACA